jgi:hypothetical protein
MMQNNLIIMIFYKMDLIEVVEFARAHPCSLETRPARASTGRRPQILGEFAAVCTFLGTFLGANPHPGSVLSALRANPEPVKTNR